MVEVVDMGDECRLSLQVFPEILLANDQCVRKQRGCAIHDSVILSVSYLPSSILALLKLKNAANLSWFRCTCLVVSLVFHHVLALKITPLGASRVAVNSSTS